MRFISALDKREKINIKRLKYDGKIAIQISNGFRSKEDLRDLSGTSNRCINLGLINCCNYICFVVAQS